MTFSSVTPNLIVSDVAASTRFYQDVLGFQIKQTVPDQAPHVFVWLERDGVPVFLNARHAAAEDYPDVMKRPAGGTAALFSSSRKLMRCTPRSRLAQPSSCRSKRSSTACASLR